ncbi:DJ-1 family glyoxalase III [Falsiporphyromonas endometrii]|uniref:DJ-1 family glyoxalase III n=1 Tax=Falsiporphyromonas endometrii TaxID=1387297 RepID=A0ABV9K9N5_9PORP
MKPTIVCLATGFEEMEAISIVDSLRRANLPVKTVSISNDRNVTGAHNVTITADTTLDEIKDQEFDCIVLPGGLPGAHNLRDSDTLCTMLKAQYKAGRKVAAICAAPLVLGHIGISEGHKMTCYPGFENELKGATVLTDGVVNDGQVITGKGPAFAIAFGLEIVKSLSDKKTSDEVAAGMLL